MISRPSLALTFAVAGLRMRRLAIGVFGVAGLALGACESEPQWKGTPVVPARDVGVFTFIDSGGRAITTAPFKSTVSLMFFGYTNCPDVCGTTLADWVRVKRALGNDAKRLRFLFVTVDPARDSPVVTQRFVAQFDSTFTGLSGDSATTSRIQKAFGVASSVMPGDSTAAHTAAHLVAHSSQVFLVDDHGKLRVMYTYGAGWDTMAADIKQLLH